MSVVVKGMEMPKKCNECNFCVNGFTEEAPVYECAALGAENVSVLVDDYGKPFDFRPDWCPLVEMPTPHGSLIDADALIADLVKYQNMLDPESREYARVLSVKSYLTLARGEAIIEAEGEV